MRFLRHLECSTSSTSALVRGAVKGRKKPPGAIDESVLVYRMETGLLETRPIGTVYGVTNLYKDVRNVDDVHEIE